METRIDPPTRTSCSAKLIERLAELLGLESHDPDKILAAAIQRSEDDHA